MKKFPKASFLKCKFCDYEWIIRVTEPKRCPACSHWINENERKRNSHKTRK